MSANAYSCDEIINAERYLFNLLDCKVCLPSLIDGVDLLLAEQRDGYKRVAAAADVPPTTVSPSSSSPVATSSSPPQEQQQQGGSDEGEQQQQQQQDAVAPTHDVTGNKIKRSGNNQQQAESTTNVSAVSPQQRAFAYFLLHAHLHFHIYGGAGTNITAARAAVFISRVQFKQPMTTFTLSKRRSGVESGFLQREAFLPMGVLGATFLDDAEIAAVLRMMDEVDELRQPGSKAKDLLTRYNNADKYFGVGSLVVDRAAVEAEIERQRTVRRQVVGEPSLRAQGFHQHTNTNSSHEDLTRAENLVAQTLSGD